MRPRVLVIDDDNGLCDLLREALSDDGYAVATVPHGAAALELIRTHEPHAILVDLRMPIMDGWSFVEQYRRLSPRGAKIVVMSAVRDAERSARQLAADAYIAKPFSLRDLSALLRRMLDQGTA